MAVQLADGRSVVLILKQKNTAYLEEGTGEKKGDCSGP